MVRSGKLVHERYYNGATAATALNNHSASKAMLLSKVDIVIGRRIARKAKSAHDAAEDRLLRHGQQGG